MPGGSAKRRPKTGGRKAGTRNKRTLDAQHAASKIVDDPEVQALWLSQARQGTLPPAILQALMHYCWGKPVDRVQHSGDTEHPLTIIVRRRDK